MRPEYITSSKPIEVRHGVIALSGYGINVAVEHSLLTLSDGVGRDRRFGAFHRVTSGIRRLIVLGHAGTISFEALRWLRDIKAAFVHIDADGSVVTTSAPTIPDDARLRRAQAMAISNGSALPIARQLLLQKLQGQHTILLTNFDDDRGLAPFLPRVESATTLAELRTIEASAAAMYWQRWQGVGMKFARRDAATVPVHWKNFDGRSSPLTYSPRRATSPTNALLNYLYALLEAETRIACLTTGLDPGLGLLHADQPSRDSLACDVMEELRPRIDAFVLDQITSRVFARKDFHEMRDGGCRILPPLTHVLAETSPKWASLVAPVVERVAAQLGGRPLPTRLSQSKRSDGRAPYRSRATRTPIGATLARACVHCGELTVRAGNLFCAGCIPANRRERLGLMQDAQLESLRRLRADGRDPAHGGAAAIARSKSQTQQHEARKRWVATDPLSYLGFDFKRDIFPQLRRVSVRKLSAKTGLSLAYCSLIRRGIRVPHPRHWKELHEVSLPHHEQKSRSV